MNNDRLHAVFENYIENFEYINNDEHEEYYKWQTCIEFKSLMDEALDSDKEKFAEALYRVRECTFNIIDSYTQPFYGLIKFAEEEPETVRRMFLDLYADTGEDLQQQMKLISDFFDRSNELLDKYYPGSYLYKQNSHSVSSYLFLYDPEHHYMYKAEQSKIMADCIEFYDDWGTGDNISLPIYYRMCNEILAEIKSSPKLLRMNQSRYDSALKEKLGNLHPDQNLHILLFDLIYCAQIYNLYDGISFKRPKSKEKQLILKKREKAKALLEEYETAKENLALLEEADRYIVNLAKSVKTLKHKAYGECEILDVNEKYIWIRIIESGEEKKLGLPMVAANKIAFYDMEECREKLDFYRPVLKKESSVRLRLESAVAALKPYEEYLE